MKTLYQFATDLMNESIKEYFYLVKETNNFKVFTLEIFQKEISRQIILYGKGISDISAEDNIIQELKRVEALEFDIEQGVSSYVYSRSREYIKQLFSLAKELSDDFTRLTAEDVYKNPHLLPIWQAVLNISSKSVLKKLFGTVSDVSISKPAAQRIIDYANPFFTLNKINKNIVVQRIERTLEGIVRDLVGRLLFEKIVENALIKENVPYLKESEYNGIDGVVYKFRADFVIPDADNPRAFIEVRKSSSRHASLYAKDKMFSAINWKGKNQKVLGIIVAEGQWTTESLRAMSKVFDFVVPVSSSEMLAQEINKYLDGDDSVLKWIIDFNIHDNRSLKKQYTNNRLETSHDIEPNYL